MLAHAWCNCAQMRLKDTEARDNVKVARNGYPQGHRTGMHLSNRHTRTHDSFVRMAARTATAVLSLPCPRIGEPNCSVSWPIADVAVIVRLPPKWRLPC